MRRTVSPHPVRSTDPLCVPAKSQSVSPPSPAAARLQQRPVSNRELRRSLEIQASLTVNEPGDRYEQEADRAADQVLGMSAPTGKPLGLQRLCPECEEELHRQPEAEEEEEEETLQTKEVQGSAPQVTSEVASGVHSLKGRGEPLPASVRGYFEPRFGCDLGDVRVHTDGRTGQVAKALNARAFTYGRHIAFAPGNFQTATEPGRRLLAHELTHTIQQRGARSTSQGGVQAYRAEDPIHVAHRRDHQALQREEDPEATSVSSDALKAVANAQKLSKQTDPAIWFDSWGNDLRDNDLDGKIDNSGEKATDGSHYKGVRKAVVCKNPDDTINSCPASDRSNINVSYKVCIDIPIEAYKDAGINISKSRWIPTFFREMSKKKNWIVFKKPSIPSLLPGDIVAARNPDHQHAGIVESGFLGSSWVINLPGPTAARRFGIFKPSGRNDMVSVPASLFRAFLDIDLVARLKK